MAAGTTVQVTLPQMGESVAEGTVLEWLKQPGDRVAEGEEIVVISTDKVDAEIPAPVSGVLVAVHASEGETVQSGSVVAEIDPSGEADAAPANGNGNGASPAADVPAGNATGTGPAEAGGELVDIVTPSAGDSVTEATLLEWLVDEGAAVTEGQDLLVVSTDKVDMELPSPASGVLEKRLFGDGDTIHPQEVIGHIRAGSAVTAPASPRAPPPPPRRPRPPTVRPRSRPTPRPRRSPHVPPASRASRSTRSAGPAPRAGSPSRTCSTRRPTAAARAPPSSTRRCAVAPPRSPAGWPRA